MLATLTTRARTPAITEFMPSTTPLHDACEIKKDEDADTVKQLIVDGADVNEATDDGEAPLLIACRHARAQVVRLLIAAGATVDKAGIDGVLDGPVAGDGHVGSHF